MKKPLWAVKEPRPLRGQPFHWRKCYFEIGDTITWIDHHTKKRTSSIVTGIKRNQWGRISYYVHDGGVRNQILLEDVAAWASGADMPIHPCVR